MERPTSDVAFTDSVKAAQERLGSRTIYAKMEHRGGWKNEITADLAAFIAERDSFYLGTASADGRPYIQHRGGQKGFLKVIDARTLAFADFGGNQQYISIGNLAENDQAFIFLMDYPHRRRIKVWDGARVVDNDVALLESVADPEYGARPERVFVFTVDAWDVNCPQHIEPRFTEAEMAERESVLRQRIAELEAELQVAKNAGVRATS